MSAVAPPSKATRPYFFISAKIGAQDAGKPPVSKPALSRNLAPNGGSVGLQAPQHCAWDAAPVNATSVLLGSMETARACGIVPLSNSSLRSRPNIMG